MEFEHRDIVNAGVRMTGLHIEVLTRNLYDKHRELCDKQLSIPPDEAMEVHSHVTTTSVSTDPKIRLVSYADDEGKVLDETHVLGDSTGHNFLVDKLQFYYHIKHLIRDADKEKECNV